MTTLTQSDIDALNEAEVSEAAALSLRKQAEALEVEALALRQGVYRGWQPAPPPVVVPPPAPPPAPTIDVLPVFKSGTPDAWAVYNFAGKRFDKALNLRRLSFVRVIGGTFETAGQALYLDGASDIEIHGATFAGAPMQSSNTQRCRIVASDRVLMLGCKVIGGLATNGIPQDKLPPLDSTGNVIGLGAGKGINIEGCDDVTVSGCDISLVHKGITVGKSLVYIIGNKVHDIRTTPISGVFASGSSVLRNVTTDSTPWQYGGAGDHGDMLHIWTDGGDIDGLVIADNSFMQGGGFPMLGIFLQAKDGGFTNLKAARNTIETANGQGWRADGCSGVIADTVLLWAGDHSDPKTQPRLDVNAPSHDLLVSGTKGLVTVDAGLVNVVVKP